MSAKTENDDAAIIRRWITANIGKALVKGDKCPALMRCDFENR